mgnify:CR=1 FL=1
MHKQRGEDTEIGRKQQNEGKERAEESAVGGVGKGIWRGRKAVSYTHLTLPTKA